MPCNVEFLFTAFSGRRVLVDIYIYIVYRILIAYRYTDTLTHCSVVLFKCHIHCGGHMFRRIIWRDNHKYHFWKGLKGDVRSLFEELFKIESGRPRILSRIRLESDRVLKQRSVQDNTTALLALILALYHTVLESYDLQITSILSGMYFILF
jgi:hypothetical protein